MFDNKRFGAYLAAARKTAGLTQRELAEKLNLTRQSISMYETGVCFPDIFTVIQMADIFNITIDALIRHGVPP